MKKAIILIISSILLLFGIHMAYDSAKKLNIARCLGCIAMEPKVEKFKEFWIEYPKYYVKKGIPSHPEWIINESKEKILMLFFWAPACEPCERQWEEMKKAGMVEGSEEHGRMTENFSYVKLFSINAPYDKKGDAIRIYTAKGDVSTPTTVILFNKNGTIYWYAFSGEANGKGNRPNIRELIKIIEKAREEKHALSI